MDNVKILDDTNDVEAEVTTRQAKNETTVRRSSLEQLFKIYSVLMVYKNKMLSKNVLKCAFIQKSLKTKRFP